MRRRFFVDQFVGDKASLNGEAAHHLGKVLRAEKGQVYEASDGSSVRLARVENVGRDLIEFALLETVPVRVPRIETTLLLSIVKFDRFEWAIEKATELGVSAIVPLAAVRSEKALVAAAAKRAVRWQKILTEVAQQARRVRPPLLHPLARAPEVFKAGVGKTTEKMGPRIMLSEREKTRPLRAILSACPQDTTRTALLAVGPEGGWTDEEFVAATAHGFAEASLGVNILRTETAVAAALAAINYAFE